MDQLLSEGVWNAVVLLRELQAKGYAGGISILRDYVRPKRTVRPSRATVRFETEPGRQLQTDWGEQPTVIAGQAVTVHFAVSTLGYSRRFHFWGTDSEDAEIRGIPWCKRSLCSPSPTSVRRSGTAEPESPTGRHSPRSLNLDRCDEVHFRLDQLLSQVGPIEGLSACPAGLEGHVPALDVAQLPQSLDE
jgi:hypothetical protein